MPQLLQVMPDRSVRHERPECSEPGPGPWQGSAANIPETKSEPVYSAARALSLMLGGVLIVTFALFTTLLGVVVVDALHDAALRAFAHWTVLGFLFVYCVLCCRAVEQN